MRSTQRSARTNQAPDEAFKPYRNLAVRVLARAFQDLAKPERSRERESARVFLAGSGLMRHWCRVAALDAFCIVNHANKVTANGDCRRDGRPVEMSCKHRGRNVRLAEET